MSFSLSRPRLLPITCAVMAGLLLVKSATLVQAATASTDAPKSAGDASSSKTETRPASAGGAPATMPDPAAQIQAPGTAPAKSSGLIAEPAEAPVSNEERSLLLDLRKRRDGLDEKSRLLDQRAAEVNAADEKLNARLQQLTALQSKLEALEAARQQRQGANWGGLVKTYEAMKPRDAAAIFDALDMQVLLQVLDRMQERRAAAVLAAMQTDRARLATQLLSEMRLKANMPATAASSPGGGADAQASDLKPVPKT